MKGEIRGEMDGPRVSNTYKFGFIGAGNMVRSIIGPLLTQKFVTHNDIIITAKTESTLDYWKNVYGIQTTYQNSEVIQNANIIFLATKPQHLEVAIKDGFNKNYPVKLENKIFVSIAAGITLDKLNEMMKWHYGSSNYKIIRVMPNITINVNEGVTLYSCNENVEPEDAEDIVEMFGQLGIVEQIDESLMDVSGALTACGPAFGYLMIEALSDGAVKYGLPRALATKFAAQVLMGAGKMVIQTGKHTGQLKDEVCSAGGTTIEGIHQLEIGNVRASLMNAIEASTKKSKSLNSSGVHSMK